jgi:hypothetical protein
MVGGILYSWVTSILVIAFFIIAMTIAYLLFKRFQNKYLR